MKIRLFFIASFILVCTTLGAKVTDLSRSGTENCYMVPSGAASYSFNALVKGNGIAPGRECTSISPSSVKGVKLIWQDADVVDESSLSFKNGRISFSTKRGVKTGNALIAIYSDKGCSDGNCLWSWHIWMTDAGECTMAGITFLDRNLGADGTALLESGRNGLFYQWGRKDPFPQNGALECPVAYGKRSQEYACGHPTTFITRDGRWMDGDDCGIWCKGSSRQDCQSVRVTPSTKTMYDPCPAGYHVPNYCDILHIKANGQHSFLKTGARWYDLCPSTPDKVGALGYYWCATIDKHYMSRACDFYIWNEGVGLGLGSHYYTSTGFCIRPQKMIDL